MESTPLTGVFFSHTKKLCNNGNVLIINKDGLRVSRQKTDNLSCNAPAHCIRLLFYTQYKKPGHIPLIPVS